MLQGFALATRVRSLRIVLCCMYARQERMSASEHQPNMYPKQQNCPAIGVYAKNGSS